MNASGIPSHRRQRLLAVVGGVSLLGGVLLAAPAEAAVVQPTHHWTFDETSGAFADTGSLGGDPGAPSNVNRVAGVNGGAVELTGATNSLVDFPSAVGSPGTDDFTVSLWIKTTAQWTFTTDVLGNRTSGSGGQYFGMRLHGNQNTTPGAVPGRIYAELRNFGPFDNFAFGEPIGNGAWRHVAVARSGATVTFCVDGVQTDWRTAAGVVDIESSNPFRLGRSYAGFSTGPAGSYDDLRVYDQALPCADAYPDTVGPEVDITTPADGAEYILDATVLAEFECTDDGSGVATCDGDVADGAAIDTSTLGSHDFTVDATDAAGNSASSTHTYTVVANTPATKAECKKGGWQTFTDDEGTPFKNQGDCVSYVATGGGNKAGG